MSIGQLQVSLGFAPALLVAALAVVVAVLLERRASGRWRGAILRGAIVGLTAAALARPLLSLGAQESLLVLVDRSASVDQVALDSLLAAMHVDGRSTVELPFGDDHTSPLATAIEDGAAALPEGGRIVILSDGRFTGPDPVPAVSRAEADGVGLDVLRVPSRSGRDAAVVAIDAPTVWRRGEDVPVSVALSASSPMSVTIRLSSGDEELAVLPASIGAGGVITEVHALVSAPDAGILSLEARVEADGDTVPDNDQAFAVTHVARPPRVMVVGDPLSARPFAEELAAAGLDVDINTPAEIPSRLSELREWDVLALVDVSAAELGMDQMAALEAFVADMGRGLVLTGGRQSYLLGGWAGTALAALAPVSLEPPPRGERDAVALLLLIDRSASMGTTDSATGISNLDLAREAASLSAEVLHPGDTLAVVAYDDVPHWVVPPTTVGAGVELAEVQERLAALEAGGGTRILDALSAALPVLADVDTPTRHAVLLSDGHDIDPNNPDYERVVRDARAAGTTLSTIAIGPEADRGLLTMLARLGRGRYHSADDPGDLPRLTVEESEILRARTEQSGDFRVQLREGREHAAASGVDLASLPDLAGYLALTDRDGAEVVLESASGDPLLSTWGYGAGRVGAWTSDSGELWAQEWRGDETARLLWRRLLYYLAPSPLARSPGVEVSWDGLEADVDVWAVTEVGEPLNLADVTLTFTGTEGAKVLALAQTEPGHYAGRVALPAVGAYPAHVSVQSESGLQQTKPVPLAANPGPELQPGVADEEVLAAMAAAGGGEVLSSAEEIVEGGERGATLPLWPLLLAGAALLWPLDVARVVGFEMRLPHLRGLGGHEA